MLNPKISPARLLVEIKRKFGALDWWNFEPETVMLELEADTDETLLYEKIMALKVLTILGQEEALSDADYVLRFCEVANNEDTDPDVVPMPNSLELAWGLIQLRVVVSLMGGVYSPPEALTDLVGYLLREDGFSSPVAPFEFVPEGALVSGQSQIDTELKKKAITAYVKYMNEETHG